MICRGEFAELDSKGKPIANNKTYSICASRDECALYQPCGDYVTRLVEGWEGVFCRFFIAKDENVRLNLRNPHSYAF